VFHVILCLVARTLSVPPSFSRCLSLSFLYLSLSLCLTSISLTDDAFHFLFLPFPIFPIIHSTRIFSLSSSALLEKIADLVNDKKLEGISDLRDESDRDGIRVVVELKRDAVPALVQNNLFKKTSLQWAFSG
jgi:DNA gyrase/topoisomerase IV, subunit A